MSTLKANSYQHVDRASPSIIINSDGSVSISSTVTYEDITSVDSVGVITGRSNADLQNRVNVGSGVSIKAGGLNVTAGISTFGDDISFTGASYNALWDKSKNALILNDNAQLNFGTDEDGDIYHDNSQMIINNATGILRVRASEVRLCTPTNSTYFTGISGGAAKLYHNDSVKLQTTTSGISISNDLNVAGISTFSNDLYISDSVVHGGDTNTKIRFPAADTITAETGGTEILRIASTGDILTQGLTAYSFNNDTANTKVFEVTGDGTAGEYGQINISGNQNAAETVGVIKFINRENSSSTTGSIAGSRQLGSIEMRADTSDSNAGDDCGGYFRFITKEDGGGNGEAVRIASDGKVGISTGTISPDGNQLLIRAKSTVGTTKGHIMLTGDGATNGEGPQIVFSESGSGSNFAGAYIGHVRTSTNSVGDLVFGTRATGGDANTVPTERIRITSDGVVSWRSGSTPLSGTGNSYSINIYRDSGSGYGYLDCVTGSTSHTGWYMRAYHNGTYNKVIAHNTSDSTWFETGGTARLTINSSGNANFTGIVTATNFVPTTVPTSHRNIFVNGSCAIAQRGASFTSSDVYVVDRWHVGFAWNGSNSVNCSQQNITTGDPYDAGFRSAIKVNSTGSSGDAAADWVQLEYAIEGQDMCQWGWDYNNTNSTISLSFWGKTSVEFGCKAFLMSDNGSTYYIYPIDIPLTTAWQKFKFEGIPGHASIAFNNTSAKGLRLIIIPYYGTNYTVASGADSNEWHQFTSGNYVNDMSNQFRASATEVYFTGLQLELGSQCTPFEHRTYGEELTLCQRYYYTTGASVGGAGQSYSANSNDGVRWFFPWPTTMRATATTTCSGGSDGSSAASLEVVASTSTGCVMNLKSTDSNTSVWWTGATVTADADF